MTAWLILSVSHGEQGGPWSWSGALWPVCERRLQATQENEGRDPNEVIGTLISAEFSSNAHLTGPEQGAQDGVRVGRLDPALLLGSQRTQLQACCQPNAHAFLSFPRLFLVMTKSLHLPESSPKLSTQPSPQLRSNKDLSPLLCPFTIQPTK